MEHLGDPGGQEMGSTARDRTVGSTMVELKHPPHFFNAGSGDDETGSQSPLHLLCVILALPGLSQAHPSVFGKAMLSFGPSLPFLPLTGSM